MAYGTVNVDKMTTSDGISSAGVYGFKNRLINGNFAIDQRNAGAIVSASDGIFDVDRWQAYTSASGKFTMQQTPSATETGYATRVAAGFTNYVACTSSAATSLGATDSYAFAQKIEGYNFADLGFGTASAKTVTLSAWVYSSLTGTFGGALSNSGLTRSYPFSYSIPTANTWTQISITITGDTSGTWLTTNGTGCRVIFSLGAGSSASGTAGSWSGNDYRSATGAVSVVGTNGATFYITGTQLEVGSTATSFDYRPYSAELAMCQRYYEATTNNSTMIFSGDVTSGQDYYVYGNWVVPKRASPTFTPTIGSQSGFSSSTSSPTVSISSWSVASTSTATGARKYYFFGYTASAEL